ncbi:hypothetical protein GCM10023075_35810 [Streptosporangium album]
MSLGSEIDRVTGGPGSTGEKSNGYAGQSFLKNLRAQPGEQSSRLVDQDVLGGYGCFLASRCLLGAFDELALEGGRPDADQGDEDEEPYQALDGY